MKTDKITCCKDCTTRHAGCHATCETYIQQKADLDAAKADARKKYEISQGLNAYRYDGISKICKTRIYRSKFRKGH